ncbi:hypothetical protein P170DRAFT_442744 [Aspergillus steynii IBT 23096]|uniref:Gylcosyl hydrolase 115 C-terminal domain-containing protein n=1 Tax=Aspergillus steynii IBT 23096 TaxID=1392250 RepID=A0A2I2GP86_9EURO|nr:uncharacterized protein P170DRAFT_442744 [Aspergillus steynii IBT 23096]PLB54690.1 hypothetical protein P170DRAFT_442744 [Aspergillus steynii IBT 23096]
MKLLWPTSLLFVILTTAEPYLLFSSGNSEYQLANTTAAPAVWVAKNEPVGVLRAAHDLTGDFGRVLSVNGTVEVFDPDAPESDGKAVILAGTVGQSTLIDKLVSDGTLDVSQINGTWESYIARVVQSPFPNVPWALAVAGSDRRGTIYGLYDISEQMGVSPWYWWADVPVKTKTGIWVSPEGTFQKSPSVKYRGFFINDESPALSGWVGENFGDTFNSAFYRRVFELCLRLKGNYLWPAMWGKMFYVDDVQNGQLAHDYGVIMGTSHYEPMARSEQEQKTYLDGEWNWRENRANIEAFFQQGIDRAKDWDTMWTMGMRGEGDAASPTLTAADLEELIHAQQKLLVDSFNTSDPASIAQTWVLYKEVSDYYAAGMEVPDSVTLLWTDDNSGNLIRVPIANETSRVAGAGVYYHFDYVGSPRSYKWINTIQLVKTWEQMHLAYQKSARQIWIANVGDIKGLEVPLTHFMDMAYDMDRFTSPDATTDWLQHWAAGEFNQRIANRTADILNQYGILVARRKYELLSQTPFAFSTIYNDEAETNLAQWETLLARTQSVYNSLDQATRTPFFEMVLHPVLAGKTVVDLYTKAALNELYHQQGRTSTNRLAQQVRDLFAEDAAITERYHSVKEGKWRPIMNQAHVGYSSWNDPVDNTNVMPALRYIADSQGAQGLGVAVQGTAASYPDQETLRLLSMDPYMPPTESRYIDIFARKNTTLSFSISSNTSSVTVSPSTGSLSSPGNGSDIRSIITVDWTSTEPGLSHTELKVQASDGSTATLVLPVNHTVVPSTYTGFIESNGIISIEASHYTSASAQNGVSYIKLPYYGRTRSAIKPWPVTMGTQSPTTGPALRYALYTTTASSRARLIISLGASHNHDPTRWIKFAYSLDGATPVTIRPVSSAPPYKEGQAWQRAVVENGWTSVVELAGVVGTGAHELSLWLLEPGVVLQKIVLDMGGVSELDAGSA